MQKPVALSACEDTSPQFTVNNFVRCRQLRNSEFVKKFQENLSGPLTICAQLRGSYEHCTRFVGITLTGNRLLRIVGL